MFSVNCREEKHLSINITVVFIFFNQEVHKHRVMNIYCVEAKKNKEKERYGVGRI